MFEDNYKIIIDDVLEKSLTKMRVESFKQHGFATMSCSPVCVLTP